MRNLKLRYSTVHDTNAVNPKFIVLDSSGTNKNTVYICTDEQLISYNLETDTATPLTDVIGVVSCEYLSLENELCIATEEGEVFLFNPSTKTTNEVTFCDGGIEKMVWSPDQEVVAFITKARSLVVMTCTFEPISEVQLDEDNFGENAFISVGWGKKETQFHGSEGKAAAKQKTNFEPPENLSELPQEINITWRADGAYFAVSFVGPYGRMFKVFDKEGSLKSTSEKLNDLWPAIAWRPSGTWVAVPHKFPNKSTIGLFEKNGLRHREIILPFHFDNEPVVDLKWSDDSDVLSVQTLSDGKSNLYLYTIGNYHWYLKQTLCFDGILSTFVWDNRIGGEKTMFAVMSNGKLIRYSWTFNIDRCQVHSGTRFSSREGIKCALVAVIDGKQLMMTDFRKGVIPPPMSNWKMECDSYINSCTFLLCHKVPGEEICFFLCTAKNELQLYKCPKNENPKLMNKYQLASPQNPLSCHNFLWLEDTKVCWVESKERGTELCHFSFIDKSPAATWKPGEVICYLEAVDEFNILAHTTDGNVSNIMFLRSGVIGKVTDNYCSTGQMCNRIEYFKRKDFSGVISLGSDQCLRSNSKTIATDVTSFHLSTNYLVFTQLAVMKFWRLDTGKVVNERKIERGAKIVTIVPNDSLTILQLPRGNLETIHPRVLCLEIVGELLDNAQYFQAMNLVRRQRINLNIICDHDLDKFLQNVNKFLSEVDAQWLNLFLTDLQNEDFTQTMYSSNYQDLERKYPEGFRIENKIAFICRKMSEEMLAMDQQKYLLPMITANVKIGSIERALNMIWEEKKKETGAGDPAKEAKADDALKYLLYLVDVNQLYDVALGMYDFGLVLMVAKKSQKDPREFLPFLNELKVLDEDYRKFRIDFHLKRFGKALLNISHCGEERFPEALQLIKAHDLYQDALSAYKDQPDCYKRIAHAYGDYLREHGKFENASMMYERAGNIPQAVACARHVLDWQRCLVLTKKEGLYPQDVATSLVPLLMEQGRYEEAFELLKRYGNSFVEGIACLLKGNLYLRAIFEARMENIDVLQSLILPHLLSYKTTLEANLNGDRELFLNYKTRLLTIREKKIKDATLDDLDESAQVDECDLLSDTTSMHSSRYTSSSRGTGKTFRSSKNRRKHERKLLSLKEGNPFEDIALIDALHNHVLKVYALQMHIRDTCKALLEVCEDVQAQALQRQFKSLLLLIRESLDEIWTPEITVTAQYITGPNVDYAALQNEQRYSMINPVKRFKPQLNLVDWEHAILR